jgi:serine-type D-Ala-D-Ala carboxypeptidase (penicillin-binding protein 5/6)
VLRTAKPRRGAPWVVAALVLASVVPAVGSISSAAGSATPPPTPVNGKPSPFVTHLSTPAASTRAPELSAPVGLLADLDTGQELLAQGPRARRPIASVTKLMTALLTFERTRPDQMVTVPRGATDQVLGSHGSELGLRPGEKISVSNLLHGLLIQSSNDAAVALADFISGSTDKFIRLMNTRAKRLGMHDTRFASASGLDDHGYSTATDLVKLTQADYRYPQFARIVQTKFFTIPNPRGKPRQVQNRNVLLWLYPGTIGVKTGFTSGARFCLVAAAERNGLRLVAVVLGAPKDPFSDAAALLNYGFAAFERHTFVRSGAPLGTVALPGGQVSGAAAGTLTALVPKSEEASAKRQILVDPGVRFPPVRGDRIGVLRIFLPDLSLGTVPVVAASVPPPPPPEPGPWWRRTTRTLVDAVGGLMHALVGST